MDITTCLAVVAVKYRFIYQTSHQSTHLMLTYTQASQRVDHFTRNLASRCNAGRESLRLARYAVNAFMQITAAVHLAAVLVQTSAKK